MRARSLVGTVVVASWLVFAGEGSAHADCASTYVQAWPEAGATGVPTNASLLVHFGADTLDSFDPSLVVLRHTASGSVVPLRVARDLRVRAAYLGRRTLLLQPTRPLLASTGYTITVRFVPGGRAPVDQSFVTANGRSSTAPTLAAATAGAYVEEQFGCGPARNVPIVLRGLSPGTGPRRWVRMRVARTAADLRAGRLLGEVIEPLDEQGDVSLGHGMCAGGWPLEPGDELVLGVSVLDAALNESVMRETMARARP